MDCKPKCAEWTGGTAILPDAGEVTLHCRSGTFLRATKDGAEQSLSDRDRKFAQLLAAFDTASFRLRHHLKQQGLDAEQMALLWDQLEDLEQSIAAIGATIKH
ncbi:MAG: hypothetical protein B7Y80_09480 [Hyphomicrobium sp. 32-62-53]|nr:MAG: hypothetical protein B7Z29_09240 [Hyphomicrobium sp. 12-62-95]OYX99811.1 MAG: hypothetical protein B7Y80_09480 [Hyphomicrobium sp. 32-62-53]